jgi:uncharacterized protein (DUF3084 family)
LEHALQFEAQICSLDEIASAIDPTIAAAIKIAQQADDKRENELLTLRAQVEDLRSAWSEPLSEAEGGGASAGDGGGSGGASSSSCCDASDASEPRAERRRLVSEISRLEGQLRSARVEHEQTKKELFAERVKTKRSGRELEDTKGQLKMAREEMSRLYDDMARARHEIARLSGA